MAVRIAENVSNHGGSVVQKRNGVTIGNNVVVAPEPLLQRMYQTTVWLAVSLQERLKLLKMLMLTSKHLRCIINYT